MQLTFGMYLDGSRWSDKPASMGELQLGPSGMLGLLATQLGLSYPTVHPATRTNQYMKRLEACDNPGTWFHDSFSADAWSTAKQMLAWRDELIGAGWDSQQIQAGSARLQALAKAEHVDIPLSLGKEGRLREVCVELKQTDAVVIKDIRLREPLELLPPIWQKIFNQLRKLGVKIGLAEPVRHESRSNNLASIQMVLNNESQTSPISENDDSLILVKTRDEWEAAENLAIWLAADRGANSEVAIVCGIDTDLLDQALYRHGLPQLGCSESSRWRASLQILPLVLANAWKPVDVQRLVELLSLSMAPVPGFAARYLLRALNHEPGVGGDAWKRALGFIAKKSVERAIKKGETGAKHKAATLIDELDAFLVADRYFPDSGIPEASLKQRCQWVIDGFDPEKNDDPMIKDAIGHAREMQNLAEGKGNIARVTVERMLDSVIGAGSSSPDRFEQAAPWQVVSDPGQITKPVGKVIWWGFIDPLSQTLGYWNDSERSSLKKLGIELEDPFNFRRREARGWANALAQAKDNFLVFFPERMNGEVVYHHPFWDEIHSAAIKAKAETEEDAVMACLTREEKDLRRDDRWGLAGREALLKKVVKPEQIPPPIEYEISTEAVYPPESLSYTQMKTMLSCPMEWALQYHVGLSVGDTLSVPTGNRMLGSLCHRVIEKLFAQPDKVWTAGEGEARAIELYDSLVGSMASELLLDGKELENNRARAAIGNAVRRLVELIERLGLTVEKTEEALVGDLNGIPFFGRADLILRDSEGNPFVLDLKWSTTSSYVKNEVIDGLALQIAVYAWMMPRASSDKWAHGGYFMLAQGELLSDSELLGDEALVSKQSLKDIWAKGTRSWSHQLETLKSGRLEAGGLRELHLRREERVQADKARAMLQSECDELGLLYQRPQCNFCDFSVLCGIKGGAW